MTGKQELWRVLNMLPEAVRRIHIKMNIPIFVTDENGKEVAVYPKSYEARKAAKAKRKKLQ